MPKISKEKDTITLKTIKTQEILIETEIIRVDISNRQGIHITHDRNN